nr:MT-A70 domain containing protein [Haemonchus contortus]
MGYSNEGRSTVIRRAGLYLLFLSGIEGELDAFFRQWKLTRLATFIWLKVTLEGDPVCPFNEGHKLPYERLVFASRAECSTLYSAISSSDGKVFASVPMAVPSRKPPVLPIVKQYGVVAKQPLELFARSLSPQTVSVGYEALLLQSSLCLISLNKDNEG